MKTLSRESVSKLKENDGNAQFSLCLIAADRLNAGSRVKRDPAFFWKLAFQVDSDDSASSLFEDGQDAACRVWQAA